VFLQILRCLFDQRWVITKHAEASIARPTQEFSNYTSRMVVIDVKQMLWPLAANGALTILGGNHRVVA
jgi:hypothetical protein